MKLTLPLLALAVASLASPSVRADSNPNFTGTWKLNVGKSELGGRPIKELTVVVEHKDPSFKYTASGVSDDGSSFDQTQELTTDNKPAQGENGTVAAAHWDGSALAIEIKSADGDVLESGRISMSADGKTFVRESVRKGPDGEAKVHEIYEKQ